MAYAVVDYKTWTRAYNNEQFNFEGNIHEDDISEDIEYWQNINEQFLYEGFMYNDIEKVALEMSITIETVFNEWEDNIPDDKLGGFYYKDKADILCLVEEMEREDADIPY